MKLHRRFGVPKVGSRLTLTASLFGATPCIHKACPPPLSMSPLSGPGLRVRAPDPALPNVLHAADRRFLSPAATTQTWRRTSRARQTVISTPPGRRWRPSLPLQLNDLFVFTEAKLSVIHFNNGMHGWGYTEAQYVVGSSTATMLDHSGTSAGRSANSGEHYARDRGCRVGATNVASTNEIRWHSR